LKKRNAYPTKEFVAPKAPVIQGSYQDVLNYRLYLKEVQVAVKEFEKLIQQEEAAKALDDVSGYDKDITGRCLVTHTHDLSADVAKQLVDRLLERLGQGTVFVVNHASGQLLLLAKTNQGIHCGNLVKGAAQLAGGNGGGKPEFAQAGAKDVTKINDILAYVKGELSCES
jgi:alanyl-tRNA synthetase